MHSSVIPCQRFSLPVASAGKQSSDITPSMTGISIRSEELMPISVFSAGTENGEIVMAAPLTRTILKRLAPMILPRLSAPCPLRREVMAVMSSGREVPKAMARMS